MDVDAGEGRLLVRVFPDYGATWPVWGRRGSGRHGLLHPSLLPDLPAELVDDLKRWQRGWEKANAEPWAGRIDPRAVERQAELDLLAQRLAAVLSAVADVETGTWSSSSR